MPCPYTPVGDSKGAFQISTAFWPPEAEGLMMKLLSDPENNSARSFYPNPFLSIKSISVRLHASAWEQARPCRAPAKTWSSQPGISL